MGSFWSFFVEIWQIEMGFWRGGREIEGKETGALLPAGALRGVTVTTRPEFRDWMGQSNTEAGVGKRGG